MHKKNNSINSVAILVFFALTFVCHQLSYAEHKLRVGEIGRFGNSSDGAIIATHSFKDLGKGQYQVSLSLQKNNQYKYSGSVKLGGKREFRLSLIGDGNQYPLDITGIEDPNGCLDSILSDKCSVIITGSMSGNPPEYNAYFLHVPLNDDKSDGGKALLDINGARPELEVTQDGRLSPNSNGDYTLGIKNIAGKSMVINVSLESGCVNLNNPIKDKNLESGSTQKINFKLNADMSEKLGCYGDVVVDYKVDGSAEIKTSWIPIKIYQKEEIVGAKQSVVTTMAEIGGAVLVLGGVEELARRNFNLRNEVQA